MGPMAKQKAKRPVHEELKRLREARGWSQGQLAAAAGVKRSTVSRYEADQRGLRMNTQALSTLRRFEEALGLPEGYFLEEQLSRELQTLTRLVKAGHVRLPQIKAVVEMGLAEERSKDGRGSRADSPPD